METGKSNRARDDKLLTIDLDVRTYLTHAWNLVRLGLLNICDEILSDE